MYWPGLDTDIEQFIGDCVPCKANSNLPPPEPITMSELPSSPWSDISIDFFGPLPTGETLLVIIDLYSRFPLVEIMKKTSEIPVINRLESIFSIFGYPESCKRDNGPPFNSHKFKQYLHAVNIKDKPITPEHPEANAVVENFNRSLKKLIRTAKYEHKDWKQELKIFLHNYRNAPHTTTGISPSMLFFNRPLKTYIPSLTKYTSQFDEEVRKRQAEKYDKVKSYTDRTRHATEKVLAIGEKVLMKRGTIGKKNDSKFLPFIFTVVSTKYSMVTVEKENGQRYTRNIKFFKPLNKNDIKSTHQSHNQSHENRFPEAKTRKIYPKRNRKPLVK